MLTLQSDMRVELQVAERRDGTAFFNLYRHLLRQYFAVTIGWDDAFRQAAFRFSFPIAQCRRIAVGEDGRFGGVVCTLASSDGAQEVALLLVEPCLQSKGIGSAVLDHIYTNAQADNESVRLSTFKLNVRAISLYLRLGFSVIGEDEHYFHFQRRDMLGSDGMDAATRDGIDVPSKTEEGAETQLAACDVLHQPAVLSDRDGGM